MKQLITKITSSLMAFMVLVSTMPFTTIDMHYCGDVLVDFSIFGRADSCGMVMQKTDLVFKCSATKKNCCSNKQIIIEGQDELKISLDEPNLSQQFFVVSFSLPSHLFEGLENNKTPYKDYVPPLVVRSIYKLDETYLI